MTTATTILALIPVLTSTGRGSDIMVPMAIPSFGGMVIEIMTMLVVPVLYCSVQEWKLKLGIEDQDSPGMNRIRREGGTASGSHLAVKKGNRLMFSVEACGFRLLVAVNVAVVTLLGVFVAVDYQRELGRQVDQMHVAAHGGSADDAASRGTNLAPG